MATETRLIDAKALKIELHEARIALASDRGKLFRLLENAPTVDAVPVDEIRVDIMSLSLENQEAILNVSICGKPNEVKLPFSKEVAEVVHGRWREKILVGGFAEEWGYVCSECGCTVSDRSNLGVGRYTSENQRLNYCPNCGAKMDGDGSGRNMQQLCKL